MKLQIRAGVRYTRVRPAAQDFKLIGDRMATCPECDAEIEVDEFDVDKGDQLSCPECGSNLEVVGMSPLELDVAPDDDEDEDDEGTDEEDEPWDE